MQMMVNTFAPKILISIFPTVCYTFLITLDLRIWLFIPIFFFTSHHFSAGYHMDIVRRNSSLVTPGSEKVRKTLRKTAPHVQGNVHWEVQDCNMKVRKVNSVHFEVERNAYFCILSVQFVIHLHNFEMLFASIVV